MIIERSEQWVISVPKRLRGMLADRPAAVAALTKIFLDEIKRTENGGHAIYEPLVSPEIVAELALPGLSFLSFILRSRFITLVHAAMKSATNFAWASSLA